jgi:hypothetical protein
MLTRLKQHKTAISIIGMTFVILALAQVSLAACGANVDPVTPTPTRTPKLLMTATPLATPVPTAIPPTAASDMAPVPTADVSIMTEFPPNVNPLTGLPVTDPATLERRPLAIKVSNSPAVVRPQAGLSFADLVFEHYAEGRVTRFTAVFLGQQASKVGSIRSGRLIDLEIPAMFKAMFAYSGSSGGVKQKIVASDFYQENRVVSPDFGVGEPIFQRIPTPGKDYEHTLFTSTEALWALTAERGLNQRQELSGLAFSLSPPKGGAPATYVELAYLPGVASAEWTFDANRALYLRSILGEPHTDELSGQQLSAANVIIVYANHVETDIMEDLVGGGHYSIEIQIWGEGLVQIVRDGRVYNGHWARWNRGDVLSFFFDESNHPMPLRPGQSWFQIVPLDFPTIIQP